MDEATSIEQELKVVKTEDDIASLVRDAREKIEREPDNINYRRALADLFTKAEKFEEAIEALEAAQEVTGGNDPQVDRSLSSIRLKMFDRDIAKLREAGDKAGVDAAELGKREFQLEDARSRVERYPNDREFKYEYGLMLFESGDFDAAIKQL